MRISDWSSDVCSSDLPLRLVSGSPANLSLVGSVMRAPWSWRAGRGRRPVAGWRGVPGARPHRAGRPDRKSVVEGQRVLVRVDLGGRRIIKKKNNQLEVNTVDTHTIFNRQILRK